MDPDQALLETVRSFFERYGKIFQLSEAATAADGALALNNEAFALLVVDADISLANGPPFLEYVTRLYPLLSVIVTGRPEALNPYAQEVGRRYLACLIKPFEANRLAERILVAVDWEAVGDTLHEVSTLIVPQMIEIEKKTCAVKVTRLSSFRHGILFFSEGALVEALCEGQTGEAHFGCPVDGPQRQRMADTARITAKAPVDKADEFVRDAAAKQAAASAALRHAIDALARAPLERLESLHKPPAGAAER